MNLYGKHTEHYFQYSSEATNEEAPGKVGESLRPQLKFFISDAVESYVADRNSSAQKFD